MEAKAIAKYVRMSPSKIKPVVDLVRQRLKRGADDPQVHSWQGS
jgi:ribosomal protein L22